MVLKRICHFKKVKIPLVHKVEHVATNDLGYTAFSLLTSPINLATPLEYTPHQPLPLKIGIYAKVLFAS
jgi:hypothetical protein